MTNVIIIIIILLLLLLSKLLCLFCFVQSVYKMDLKKSSHNRKEVNEYRMIG